MRKDAHKQNMSEPYITLANSNAMTATGFTGEDTWEMSYLLYADEYAYDNWADWVNDSVSSPTQKNRDNASTYTNYVLKIYCKLSAVNNACGFNSAEHGAIMIASNAEGEI